VTLDCDSDEVLVSVENKMCVCVCVCVCEMRRDRGSLFVFGRRLRVDRGKDSLSLFPNGACY